MATRYWIGGSGNWNDTSNWSSSSGGAGGASVPTSTDNVVIDSNSGFGSGGTITLNGSYWSAECHDFTSTSGHSYSIDYSSSDLSIFGSAALEAGVTFTSDTWLYLASDGSGTPETFNANSADLNLVIFGGLDAGTEDGNWTLTGGATAASGFYVLSGSFDADTYNITAEYFYLKASGGYTTTVNMGSGIWKAIGYSTYGGDGLAAFWTSSTTGSTLTINAETSTIKIDRTVSTGATQYFYGSGKTYNNVWITGSSTDEVRVFGSNTFSQLRDERTGSHTVRFSAGTTQTTTDFDFTASTGAIITIASSGSGTHTLSQASGTVDATGLNLTDSVATGGATWNANNSVDNGGNSGWNFVYTTQSITDAGAIASTAAVGSPTVTQSDPPPAPDTDWSAIGKEDEKVYIYKVYQADGTYIGVWTDVKDDLEFTQYLNTPGTTTTVTLARSADTTKESRAALLTEAGDTLTTEDNLSLAVAFETSNTVGEDTDVDLNYNVDVYVVYGEYENIITESGDLLTTEDGDYLIVASGAPMGTRVFSGFILDYAAEYGDESSVVVTLASNGYEMAHQEILDTANTTKTYTTTEIGAIIEDILDTNAGTMTYSADSIADTSTSITIKYELNSKLEGIKSAFDQTPDGWYWFGNVADNLIYLQEKAVTADHTFIKGLHIKKVKLKRSMEFLKNRVYFVGAESTPGDPSTALFKKYEDATSQSNWRVGLERIVDRRYSLAASASNRSNKLIGRYKDPIYTTTLTISSARYDLESIRLGQMVGFAGFGNFVDTVLLQIVALTYKPTEVTLQLGEIQERQVDLISEVNQSLQNEQYQALPTAPS